MGSQESNVLTLSYEDANDFYLMASAWRPLLTKKPTLECVCVGYKGLGPAGPPWTCAPATPASARDVGTETCAPCQFNLFLNFQETRREHLGCCARKHVGPQIATHPKGLSTNLSTGLHRYNRESYLRGFELPVRAGRRCIPAMHSKEAGARWPRPPQAPLWAS